MARLVVSRALRLLAAVGLLAALPARALPDPTRAPAGWGPGESLAAPPAAPAPTRLQLIVRSRDEPPWALIDGRRVGLGERVDGARLIQLTDHEAILQEAGTTRRLSLTPGVTRRTIPAAPPPETRR